MKFPSGTRLPIPLTMQSNSGEIVVRGARLHNLKNLTLSIPHNKLTVITGVSGRASLRWPSTPSTPKASAATWSRCRRTRGSSLSAWRSRRWMRSTASRRPSRSGRRTRRGIPGLRSPLRPKSTTSCACSGRARAGLFVRSAGGGCAKDTVDQVAQRMLAEPEGRAYSRALPGQKHATPKAQIPRSASGGTSLARLQPALAERRGVRVLHARVAARYRLGGAGVRAGGPDCHWPDLHQRMVDTVEICYRESGDAIFHNAAHGRAACYFSERFMCKYDNLEFREPEPILFSFNSPAALPALPGIRQHHRLFAWT